MPLRPGSLIERSSEVCVFCLLRRRSSAPQGIGQLIAPLNTGTQPSRFYSQERTRGFAPPIRRVDGLPPHERDSQDSQAHWRHSDKGAKRVSRRPFDNDIPVPIQRVRYQPNPSLERSNRFDSRREPPNRNQAQPNAEPRHRAQALRRDKPQYQSQAQRQETRVTQQEKPVTDQSSFSLSQNFNPDLESFTIESSSGDVRKGLDKRRRPKSDPGRRSSKFALDDEEEELENAQEKARKERKRQREREKAEAKLRKAVPIELPAFISIANLATALRTRVEPFISKMKSLGFEEFAPDHVLNFEDAGLIAMEYGYEPQVDQSDTQDIKPRVQTGDRSSLPPRPPVVTIMGHVDHGKTTLLDYLRKSSVAATEHGGITQHIGAFSVPMASGKTITFLDTPGHAAFLSMRQRGANVTDIVILVVAADDSVKPQTIEAIKHAKSAQVPIIVAINKVDKDEADIERVKQDLMRYGVEVEDFHGDVQAIPVSGKTGLGMKELEEALVTQAEILDMRAEADGPAEGWVLEASTQRAGRVATVLVRCGTLKIGDVIVAGTTWARVRTLRNEAGVSIESAPPGTPVAVDGWRDQPVAGDEVLQAASEQKAVSVIEYRMTRLEQVKATKDMEVIGESRRIEAQKRTLEKEKAAQAAAGKGTEATAPQEELEKAKPEDGPTELSLIVKADTSGSIEAVCNAIESLPLSNHPVRVNIIRSGVGQISEFDIDQLLGTGRGNAFVLSFNQPVLPGMSQRAEQAGIQILDENIIYRLIDNVKSIVESRLPPIIKHKVNGEAEIAQPFDINVGGRKFMKIAGCRVQNGMIAKGSKVKVIRGGLGDDGTVVYDGSISSLKHHKKEVSEMRKGTECGMAFDGWEAFQPQDIVQCYGELHEKRRLV